MYAYLCLLSAKRCMILMCLLLVVTQLVAQTAIKIPKSTVSPIIDAELDEVWLNVPSTRMFYTSEEYPFGWVDLTGVFRAMWSETCLSFYVQVIDETIRYDGANSWDDDSIELYFDANNSKVVGYDQVDDIQLRFCELWKQSGYIETHFGELNIDWGFDPEGIVYWMRNTDYGYDLEVSFPHENLKLIPLENHEFGLEFQVNDNDDGIRNTILKWWTESNDSWYNASLFGTAKLDTLVVSDTLVIPFTHSPPHIDGTREAIWDKASFVSLNHYTLLDPPLDQWDDLSGCFEVLWDEKSLYVFCTALDEQLINDSEMTWQDDNFEIFLDGNYSRGSSYDHVDDGQYMFRWASQDVFLVEEGVINPEPIQFVDMAQSVTSQGWNLEFSMPLASINIPHIDGHVFGFEVALDDDDDGGDREHRLQYWHHEDAGWTDPSTFGSAKLINGPPNQPPLAQNDNEIIAEDTEIDIDVLNNDTDGNGDVLTVTFAHSMLSLGDVTINPGDSSLHYAPVPEFSGADTLLYVVSDSRPGGQDSAYVFITIIPVNDPPVAENDKITTDEDVPLSFPLSMLLSNDTDVEGDTLRFHAINKSPAMGTARIDTNTTMLTYTPNLNFYGDDAFDYSVSDGHGGFATATVLIQVNPVNDAPLPFALISPADGDTAKSNILTFNWRPAKDPEEEKITYALFLNGAGRDTAIVDIADTSVTVDGNRFFVSSELYTWHVVASDGEAETACIADGQFYSMRIDTRAELEEALPEQFCLQQNYPNPFNPLTTIQYDLPKACFVKLTVYDALGKVVQSLVSGNQQPGRYMINFHAQDVSSGLYFYKLQAGDNFVDIKKMLLVR